MDDLKRAEHANAEYGFEIEIIDLEQAAVEGSSKYPWLAETLLNWQRPSYRRHWRWTSTICILVLLIIMFSLSNGLSPLVLESLSSAFAPRAGLSSLSLAAFPPQSLPQQDGITCLVDAAWSPDAKWIAILGYKQNCPLDTYKPGLVNIYDARLSHLITQLHPDNAVLRTFYAPLASPQQQSPASKPTKGNIGGSTVLAIYYTHILWSPDGSQLALTFNTAAVYRAVNGVMLISKDSKQAKVSLQHQNPAAPFYAEWNLGRNRSVPLNIQSSSKMPLPAALAYHWNTNGALVPQNLLTNKALATLPRISPVGNPDGSSSFTIWQPGFANLLSLEYLFNISNVYTWNTDFAAWSPDGQYLVEGIRLSGVLKPPGRSLPPRKILALTGMNTAPVLPVRDAAFMEIVDTDTELAWSPNGRVVAAYNGGNAVYLYDCLSGHRIRSFHVYSKYAGPSVNFVLMRWSPDGTKLLLSSVTWGLVAIWGPIQLPK